MEFCTSQGNKYLADKILPLVKDNPNRKLFMKGELEWQDEYRVFYTTSDKEQIKKMYNAAFGKK